MKIITTVILLSSSLFLFAQTNEEKVIAVDSNKVFKIEPPEPDLNFLINKAELLRYITMQTDNAIVTPDNSKLWLESKVTLDKNFFAFDNDELPYENLLSPLMQQYQSKQKMAPLYYILGTAQTAAVGYLAYKHIKKYGFK